MIRPAVQARSGRLEDVGRSDVRFALTHPVHRVAIADASDRWSLAFGGVGLEVADLADWDSADPPDLEATKEARGVLRHATARTQR